MNKVCKTKSKVRKLTLLNTGKLKHLVFKIIFVINSTVKFKNEFLQRSVSGLFK